MFLFLKIQKNLVNSLANLVWPMIVQWIAMILVHQTAKNVLQMDAWNVKLDLVYLKLEIVFQIVEVGLQLIRYNVSLVKVDVMLAI